MEKVLTQCPICFTDNVYQLIPIAESKKLFAICTNKICNFKEEFYLPTLNKKIIYLDQFCISGIAKARTGNDKDERYKELDKKLTSLVKHQFIICPSSHFHHTEISYIADDIYKTRLETQKVDMFFSARTKFKDVDSIIEIELMHVLNFLQLSAEKTEFKDLMLDGDRNAWYFFPEIRSIPKHIDGSFRQKYVEYLKRYLEKPEKTLENILNELVDDYIRGGYLKPHFLLTNSDNLLKSLLKKILPFQIIARLLQVLSKNQGRKIDTGMALDILMISHTLPYVDAIFVDKSMHAYTNQANIDEIYKKRIFSFKGDNRKNDINMFINFLDSIEAEAHPHRFGPFELSQKKLAVMLDKSLMPPTALLKLIGDHSEIFNHID